MGAANRIASIVVLCLLAIVGIALVASLALNQPVLIGFIETGSMEPTINAGDGYMPIPAFLAGEIEEGDVITFDAETIDGGGTTTHRVVGVTEEGYITQGDANPVTDQDGGEPPVSHGQVQGVALQVNGDVVRLPHIGTAANYVSSATDRVQSAITGAVGLNRLDDERSLAVVLFALGVLVLGASYLRSDRRERPGLNRSRDSSRINSKWIIGGMAIMLMLAATAGMLGPAGSTTFEVVSSQSDSDSPRVVAAGGESDRNYSVANGGILPVYVYLTETSNGVSLDKTQTRLSHGESENFTVTTSAPPELGLYTRSIQEYRYLAIFPASVNDRLYAIHPAVPLFAINAVIGAITVLIGFAVLTRGSVRVRSRSRGGFFGSR